MEEVPQYSWLEETLEELSSHDSAYWRSRTPKERLHALEWMRQKTYGYDPATTRIQRVIKIIQLKNS